MTPTNITTDNTVFVLLSFEGPDHYSLAGGLGVRITNLAQALADTGFETHLFFIGDPKKKGEETANEGNLVLHRWCQWISEYYPNGVYQGENEKLYDFNDSIPLYVTENIVRPAVARDKLVVILGEEWHTAEAMCRLSDYLYSKGLRNKVVMFWNANNTFGFDRINWGRLDYTTTITTVSWYMKHLMWRMGLNPLVIPNGIPESLLDEVDTDAAAKLRQGLNADVILTKVARWDPDKRWLTTVEALAKLKASGMRTVLLARGGIEPHGSEVIHKARSLGLRVRDALTRGNTLEDYFEAITDNDGTDMVNIRFHCPQEFLRIVYHASNAVLANSGHEPFGLVGLEAMAAEGIAFTGGTGEDYAIPFHNAVVLETSNPGDISEYVMYLEAHPLMAKEIRKAAKETARRFTWGEVCKNLIHKLEYQARNQGALDKLRKVYTQMPELPEYQVIPRQEVIYTPKQEAILVGSA
jgi:glycosyltransferase involved in cell wall biosynthesis